MQISSGYMVFYDALENKALLNSYYPLQNLLGLRRKNQTDNILILNWKDSNNPEGKLQVIEVQDCENCM